MIEYTFKFKKEAKKCQNGTSFTQHKNLPTGGQVRFDIHETAKILFALSSEARVQKRVKRTTFRNMFP